MPPVWVNVPVPEAPIYSVGAVRTPPDRVYVPEEPARLPMLNAVIALYVPPVCAYVTFEPEELPILKLVTAIELAVNVNVPPSILSVLVPGDAAIALVTLKSPPLKV